MKTLSHYIRAAFISAKFLSAAFIAITLSAVTPQALAGSARTIEVYETYNPAHKVAEVLDDLLDEQDKITFFRNRLIIKASHDTHDKIVALLKDIDRAPASLLISLRVTDNYDAKKSYHNGELRYVDDKNSVSINSDNDLDTAQKNTSDDNVVFYRGSSVDKKITVSIGHRDNVSTRTDNLLQQIRAVEHEPAYIQTGDELPITQWTWANGALLSRTEYDVATQGFYVEPTLADKNTVMLTISFKRQRRKVPGSLKKDTERIATQVIVPLNEWAPLAGSTQGAQRNANSNKIGGIQRHYHTGNQRRGIEIKVERFGQ